MDIVGIDLTTSRMQSERSTIWAKRPPSSLSIETYRIAKQRVSHYYVDIWTDEFQHKPWDEAHNNNGCQEYLCNRNI